MEKIIIEVLNEYVTFDADLNKVLDADDLDLKNLAKEIEAKINFTDSYTMIKVKDIHNFQSYTQERYVKKQDGTYLNIVTDAIETLETVIEKFNQANLMKALNGL